MSKAQDFKDHSDKMFLPATGSDRPIARILNDGTLKLYRTCTDEMYFYSGLPPADALALGRWLVEMYGEEP